MSEVSNQTPNTQEASEDLKLLCSDFKYAYDEVFEVVMKKIEDRVNQLGLPQNSKDQFVSKGFDIISDLALRLTITKTSNRDNLALKALESISNMIGLIAQGGLEVDERQFEIFYSALKAVLLRAGIEIPDYSEAMALAREQG